MPVSRAMFSCSALEMHGLPDGQKDLQFDEHLKAIARAAQITYSDRTWNQKKLRFDYTNRVTLRDIPAFIVYVQARSVPNGWGDQFARELKRQGLGSVSVSEPRKNPNSGNVCKMFVWTVNRTAYAKKLRQLYRAV